MKFIDTWDIPFPKTLDDLAALNATREVPYLKALCNRRFIHVPGENPTPTEIIPYIEQRLARHRSFRPLGCTDLTDIYVEWRLIEEDLAEFLANLKQLTPPVVQVSSPATSNSALPVVAQVSRPTGSRDFPVARFPQPPQSEISNLQSEMPSTSGHFNNSPQTTPKTPEISTNPSHPPKTPGHFNNPPQKISSTSEIANHQSSIVNHQSTPSTPPTDIYSQSQIPRPRRNHPVLSKLTDDQKQQLVDLCDTMQYDQAAIHAREKLNIQISPSTLCNLYTTWRIKEDDHTRDDLQAATAGAPVETLTEKQLQLRLLQLASRPNMDHTELRAICHSFARLQSVKLSERRVQLAEAKEARLARKTEPAPFDQEYNEFLDVAFGPAVGANEGYIPSNQQNHARD